MFKSLLLPFLLSATLPLHAQTLCLYTADGIRIDRFARADIIFRPVQAKNRRGETVISLAAGYLPHHSGHTKTCFKNRNWLRKKDGIALVDTQGRELYEGVLTADAHLITEADAAGYFPVRKNGLYGYADAQTGKISIPPQFAAAAAFEKHNGTLRAVAARRAETYPFGQTDLMSAYYSENWLYIDPQGNTLPQRPNLPGGCIPQPYCQNSLPERFSGRLKP